MTTAVQTFPDAVQIEETALAGSSWSGGWALAFAQQHPDRVSRLMLLAPSGLDEPDPSSWEVLKLPVVGRAVTNLGAMSESTAEASGVDRWSPGADPCGARPDRSTPGVPAFARPAGAVVGERAE